MVLNVSQGETTLDTIVHAAPPPSASSTPVTSVVAAVDSNSTPSEHTKLLAPFITASPSPSLSPSRPSQLYIYVPRAAFSSSYLHRRSSALPPPSEFSGCAIPFSAIVQPSEKLKIYDIGQRDNWLRFWSSALDIGDGQNPIKVVRFLRSSSRGSDTDAGKIIENFKSNRSVLEWMAGLRKAVLDVGWNRFRMNDTIVERAKNEVLRKYGIPEMDT